MVETRKNHIDQAISVTSVPGKAAFKVDLGNKVLVGDIIPVDEETGTALVVTQRRVPILFRYPELQK